MRPRSAWQPSLPITTLAKLGVIQVLSQKSLASILAEDLCTCISCVLALIKGHAIL